MLLASNLSWSAKELRQIKEKINTRKMSTGTLVEELCAF